TLANVTQISAGFSHTCALSSDGNGRCWGWNQDGQLGDGTSTTKNAPAGFDLRLFAKRIAAGESHTCVILPTGGARCCGGTTAGELGTGSVGVFGRPNPTLASTKW